METERTKKILMINFKDSRLTILYRFGPVSSILSFLGDFVILFYVTIWQFFKKLKMETI